MGVPDIAAKHALYKTGNQSADTAINWYFENMADESLKLPLKVKNEKKPRMSRNEGANNTL